MVDVFKRGWPKLSKRGWWWIGGGAAVAIAAVITAFTMVPGGTPGGPTPAASAGSAAASTAPSSNESASPSAVSSPSPSRKVKKLAYCDAYAKITSTSVSPTQDEDAPADLAKLSSHLKSLQKQYARAAKAAPSSLDSQYAKVLDYLTQMRKAADSNDPTQVVLLVKNLNLLNESMSQIASASKEICG